jgi:hypothetical protein
MGRDAKATELKGAYVYFASDASSYCTVSVLNLFVVTLANYCRAPISSSTVATASDKRIAPGGRCGRMIHYQKHRVMLER